MRGTAKLLGGRTSKHLLLSLCLLLCSCRRAYDDPLRNRLTGIQTNLLGKWETLWISPAPRFGNNALDAVFSHRDTWGPGNIGKGFEFCRDGTLKVYSFTNATPRTGTPVSTS